MAAPLKANVDDVMKIAKEMAEMVEPSLKEMSGKERNDVEKMMKKRISKEFKLTDSLADAHKLSDVELAELMKKLLSGETYKKIAGYVDQETYTMEIKGSEATVQRGNKTFRKPIQLKTAEGIMDASMTQIASLIVECVFFVLGVIGINVAYDEYMLNKIIEEILPVVRQPAFQRIVNEFVEAWSEGNAWEKAKAIYTLVKATNAHGIFWAIVKAAFVDMPWYDRIITLASVAAMIGAAFATDGLALIAKIALSVKDAYNLTKKVINLAKLKEMNMPQMAMR